jgi:hypothetical protein
VITLSVAQHVPMDRISKKIAAFLALSICQTVSLAIVVKTAYLVIQIMNYMEVDAIRAHQI